MTGNPHPAVPPFEARDAAEIIAYNKLYIRVQVADAAEVGSTDFSGQFGGLYIKANAANYKLDTEDLSEDDGVNVVYDAVGNHFVKVVDEITATSKLITATGDLTIADDETADEIEINNTSGGAISVYLPDAEVRTKPLTVTDVGANAATYSITILPKADSGQTIMTGANWVIDSNGGGIRLTPNSAGTGYK